MSPMVHFLLAWLLAVVAIKEVRDRRLVVLAGILADIDGVFILFDMELYIKYHHVLGHTIFFGILLSVIFFTIAKNRTKTALVALGAFLLHALADMVGSNWDVYIFYPVSDFGISMAGTLSDTVIYGIINPVVMGLAFIGVILVMYYREITPLEFLSERLDKKIGSYYVYPLKYKCEICGKMAYVSCSKCGRKVCARDAKSIVRPICKECNEGSMLEGGLKV